MTDQSTILTSAELDDVLVHITQRDHATQTYRVQLVLEGGRTFSSPMTLSNYHAPYEDDPATLRESGLDLFNRLFTGPLASAFHQAWAAALARQRRLRLRLWLDSDDPRLHAVPWELMFYDDSGGLSPPRPLAIDSQIALSRYLESTIAEGEPVGHRPVRLLAVIPEPHDLDAWSLEPVDKAIEQRDFENRFSPIQGAGQFSYDFLPQATPAALHDALERGSLDQVRDRGYDVVLFYGHALHLADEGIRLVMEDAQTGNVKLHDGAELILRIRELQAHNRPSLVVLVACNSATVSDNPAIGSLAAGLLTEAGVPAVLAMQRLVEITLARSFTYHLSEQLLRDGVIDVAVNAARRQVFKPEGFGWSTPVLYMRNPDGRLFRPNAQLEYTEAVLNNPEFIRWRGPAFINLGVLAVAPGQDWRLLHYRPEDAPSSIDVLEALRRTTSLKQYERSRQGKQQQQRRIAQTIQPTSNITALLGLPHSGQTTVLKRFTLELADRVAEDATRTTGIYISLAGYEQQRGNNRLERHIVEVAKLVTPALGDELATLFQLPPRWTNTIQPRYIFLLDDLDVLPNTPRLDVANEIAALASRMVDHHFVVSCAQDTFPTHALERAAVLLLQPLDEHQVMQYLRERGPNNAAQRFRQIRDNRLIALASDPSLLALIYERITSDQTLRITRNQLVQEYLDRTLSDIVAHYSLGDSARASLAALAWRGRWQHKETLSLDEVFDTLARVRGARDYGLEELYTAFCAAHILVGVGTHTVQFANPALHAYCAALALNALPDFSQRMADIITMCSDPDRLNWWEDVLYGLAGLMNDPTTLFENLAAAIRAGSQTHALVAARCLEALPLEREIQLPRLLRQELLDTCVLRVRADREPSAERRAQIVTALGRLNYPQVRHELKRILVSRVRDTSSGKRYEYTNVRIAAARALRNLTLQAFAVPAPTPASDTADLRLPSDYNDQASLQVPAMRKPPEAHDAEIAESDAMLMRLLHTWQQGSGSREIFRDILRNSPSAPERALAAFALGDLVDEDTNKLLDAKQLLRLIVRAPGDDDPESPDWEDTMWAAADALTLFDPEPVAALLTVLIQRRDDIPDSGVQQLAYLAGRVRATNEVVIDWLIETLVTNSSQSIKSKALQSLAWMGLGIPQRHLSMPGDLPGPTLKQLIQDIAAWRTPLPTTALGVFNVKLRSTDREADGTPLYLRRKAIEALAWIGDADTLNDLSQVSADWPLELREYWYATAAAIRAQVNGRRIVSF